MTIWRPIADYEGLYKASDGGQVWSTPRPRTRGGPLKPTLGKNGYLYVTLTKGGVQKRFPLHRLMAATFIGPPPPGQEVRHKDGDRQNCRADNLLYGTHGENMQDMVRHGRGYTSRTHCPHDHPYDEANTRIMSNGGRACIQCSRDRAGYKGGVPPGERTHCPQDHEYTPENTYRSPSGGGRQCRTCIGDRRAARAQAAKAARGAARQ